MSLRFIQPSVAGVTVASNVVLLGVIAIGSWLALADIERRARRETGDALGTVLETSNGALTTWARNRWGNASELAQEPEARDAMNELLRAPVQREQLLANPRLAELRARLAYEAEHHEHEGFLVIEPGGACVGSMDDVDVGRPSAIATQRPDAFARALAGQAVLVPPLRSHLPGEGSEGQSQPDVPAMFVAAPVRADDGSVVGVFALRLDPRRDFSRLIELARVGDSGETYVFDREGRVLTGLRFGDELHASGLLEPQQSPILELRVADPGKDVRRDPGQTTQSPRLPLTRAAEGALSHGRGRDVDGYRDYRGVRVLGAWMWNEELGVGLTSELDEDEALRLYHATRRSITALVVVAAFMSIFLTWLVHRVRSRGTRALAEREARMRSILDTALDGIITIDAQGRIETVNAAAASMFGYAGDQLLGQELSVVVPSASTPRAFIEQHLCQGEGHREVEGRRKDGTTFPLELGLAPLASREGEALRYTGVLRDIEARKSLETRFLQSQKLQAVGQLAAGVAHDFNNLLMGVSGSARVALNRLDDPDRVRQLLEAIRGSTALGASITRQLLTMTRLKSGQSIEVELDAAVDQSRAMLERLIGEDVHLLVALGAPGAWLRCGDGHIEQLLINLVVNARDAMPRGGRLEIRTRVHELVGSKAHGGLPPGSYVELEVSDDGMGMDEEVRKRIFEPFFTTKEVGKGTGLGLSTVYGLVSQSGGTVEVDSVLGEGTTFHVFLPQLEAPSHEHAVSQTSPEPSRAFTVLVVEDEALVRSAVGHYLRTAGHRVLVAAGRDEAQAVAAAHEGPIDALITDVVLRKDAGPDVAADLRARDPRLAVVYMSAHPAEYLWKMGRLPPNTDVLQKPFESEELLGYLGAAVEAAGVAEAAAVEGGSHPVESATSGSSASSESPAVLLVEDLEPSREAMAELLRDEGLRVLAARNGAEAEQCYEAEHGEVVVVTDLGLPDVPGDVLVRRLAQRHPLRGVVLVSGRGADDPKVVEVLAQPQTAYLQKPMDIDALVEQIRRFSSVRP